MQKTIDETNRRREKQLAYNEKHGIVPQLMNKPINVTLPTEASMNVEEEKAHYQVMSGREKTYHLEELKELMRQAALALDFEKAAEIRDRLRKLQEN